MTLSNNYLIETMKMSGLRKQKRTVEAKKYFVYCIEADAWLGRDSSTRDYFLTDEPFQTFRWAQLAPNLKCELRPAYTSYYGKEYPEREHYSHYLAQFDWLFVEA